MTTVQISLPDQLALEAQQAGILSSERIEQWVREQLRQKKVNDFFAAMDRMDEVVDPAPMSPDDLADQIRQMRKERLGARGN